MAKRRYRFGIEYFMGWTISQIEASGYTVVFDGKKFLAKAKEK